MKFSSSIIATALVTSANGASPIPLSECVDSTEGVTSVAVFSSNFEGTVTQYRKQLNQGNRGSMGRRLPVPNGLLSIEGVVGDNQLGCFHSSFLILTHLCHATNISRFSPKLGFTTSRFSRGVQTSSSTDAVSLKSSHDKNRLFPAHHITVHPKTHLSSPLNNTPTNTPLDAPALPVASRPLPWF